MYSFAIIGAGQIAAGYDSPGDKHVLTHAHAITLNPRASLLGFYDVNRDAANKASAKWGGTVLSDLADLIAASPDVVVVCTPDQDHLPILEYLLDSPPAVVVCEKPLTTDYLSSVRITEAYQEKGVCLAINYQRRFDPVIIELRRRIDEDELGVFLGGTAYYTKGLMHNGSHAIDLLRFLFGEVQGYLSAKKTFDFTARDPSVSGFIRFKRGDVALIPGDARIYSIFEIDLLFEKARYKFSHSGMKVEIQKPIADDVYPGYVELFSEDIKATGFTNTLGYLVDECIAHLADGIAMRNLATTALGTQLLCEKMALDEVASLTRLGN